MARWKFTATDAQRSLVENLAAFGIPQAQICELVLHKDKPIVPATLQAHFRRELDTGEIKATAKIAGALYTSALAGNTVAQIFWLKTRAKWHEVPPAQRVIVQNPDGVAQTITAAVMAERVSRLDTNELKTLLALSAKLHHENQEEDA